MNVNQGRNLTGTLAFDAQSLEQLKLQAKGDPAKAVAGAARQFEGMFLGMVLKSMREATPQDGMFDSEQTKMYTSLLDQQLAQHLAARGTGLAEVMARQLSANAAAPAAATETALPPMESAPSLHEIASPGLSSVLSPTTLDFANRTLLQATEAARATASMTRVQADSAPKPPLRTVPVTDAIPAQPQARDGSAAATAASPLSKTRDFIHRVWQHALDAAQAIGIKPQFIVGQAALESGWGQREIRNANGATTHNLFGVKAGKDWSGPVVERTTTEYVNGVAQKTTAKFRVYSSYAESFNDYANVLRSNPRYSAVIGQGKDAAGFARGLQKAGYATDPAYANKLMRLINGPSLKQAVNDVPPTQATAKIDVNA